MLKDLVAANNSSPELQHYIDSINPSKIKFSTDILTVKNQDPMKEKEAAQDRASCNYSQGRFVGRLAPDGRRSSHKLQRISTKGTLRKRWC